MPLLMLKPNPPGDISTVPLVDILWPTDSFERKFTRSPAVKEPFLVRLLVSAICVQMKVVDSKVS